MAANNSAENDTIAKTLLHSLPNPNLPFSGGWLFDYALEPDRAQHPIVSRRWSYRSACRIPVDGQQDQHELTTKSESDSASIQDEEMELDDSDPAESQDVDMEENGSESDESRDLKMEEWRMMSESLFTMNS